MLTKSLLKLGGLALAAVFAGCGRQISFSDDIQPLLSHYCVECHDAAAEGETASGLNLATYERVMQGTRFGPVVVPGSSMSSALYLTVAGKTAPEIHMPRHHDPMRPEATGTLLSRDQIDLIATWIEQGAKDN